MSWMDSIWFYPYIITAGIIFTFYIIFIILIIKKYIVINKGLEKKDYLPLIYGLVFISLLIGRIFSMIFDITTDYNPANYTEEDYFWWRIGISFQILAFALFFIVLEMRVMKGRDKYIPLILYFAFYLYGLITEQVIYIMLALIFAAWIPIAYLYVAIQSDGNVRKRALLISFGIIIFMLAAILMSSVVIRALGMETLQMHFTANIMKIIAINLLYFGYK
ncbi:MAG: hypothetical protein EU533_05135 [Promethearchaeota archaeon]|nr:MAG: hypothetical protein EU533_05135 [Candidatus Lokiarchaeota archaeon]